MPAPHTPLCRTCDVHHQAAKGCPIVEKRCTWCGRPFRVTGGRAIQRKRLTCDRQSCRAHVATFTRSHASYVRAGRAGGRATAKQRYEKAKARVANWNAIEAYEQGDRNGYCRGYENGYKAGLAARRLKLAPRMKAAAARHSVQKTRAAA